MKCNNNVKIIILFIINNLQSYLNFVNGRIQYFFEIHNLYCYKTEKTNYQYFIMIQIFVL